jgi:hypothetical protein
MRPADRGALIGANGTGKSTLAAYVLHHFRQENPHARICVFDTKPRWRAEYLSNGGSPRSYYKAFAPGDKIPGSMSLQRMRDWDLVWDPDVNPSQTVIVQNINVPHRFNVGFQTLVLEKFFATQRANRPSLAYLDEGMDFFTTSSSAYGSDIVQRCFRAGREKNLATLIGAQRPKQINAQVLTETSWLSLFRINFAEDVRRLHEMGFPRNVGPPTYDQPHAFRLWREGRPVAPLYRLSEESQQEVSNHGRGRTRTG